LQQAINIALTFRDQLRKGINPLEEKARIENIPTLSVFLLQDLFTCGEAE
jgi:hypothetical protein